MTIWVPLIYFLVSTAMLLGIGYPADKGMLGREAAQRNLRYVLPLWGLFGLAITFLLPLFGKYDWVNFYIFNLVVVIGFSIWLLSWFSRKQEAGVVLLDVGRTTKNKRLLWVGLFEVALAGSMIFKQVLREFSPHSSLVAKTSSLGFWWSFALNFMIIGLSFIVLGLSKLEFRENGICFLSSFIVWQRVNSYNWEQSKPNTLTIRFKPRYPLFPPFMSMAIPAKHQDAVSHILKERLPEKNL